MKTLIILILMVSLTPVQMMSIEEYKSKLVFGGRMMDWHSEKYCQARGMVVAVTDTREKMEVVYDLGKKEIKKMYENISDTILWGDLQTGFINNVHEHFWWPRKFYNATTDRKLFLKDPTRFFIKFGTKWIGFAMGVFSVHDSRETFKISYVPTRWKSWFFCFNQTVEETGKQQDYAQRFFLEEERKWLREFLRTHPNYTLPTNRSLVTEGLHLTTDYNIDAANSFGYSSYVVLSAVVLFMLSCMLEYLMNMLPWRFFEKPKTSKNERY